MNWAWTTSLEQLWRSPTFPMWLALGAAAFFGLIVLVTLLRAQKSVANGALAVIALLAIGAAAAVSMRGFDAGERSSGSPESAVAQPAASLPALACVDDIAGDTVLAACEKVLFGSADSVAAAVSYTGAMIDRLTAAGDVATANKKISASVTALRRAVERDRYGLVAYVLQVRDRCQPGSCAAYAALSDHNQISANMEERTYDGLVSRYAPGWNAPQPVAGLASLPASVPTGKPTNAEFPTSASIPPINIMTPEPPLSAPRSPPAAANAQAAAPRPAAAPAAKKPPPPKPARPAVQSAPVQLAPAAAEPDN